MGFRWYESHDLGRDLVYMIRRGHQQEKNNLGSGKEVNYFIILSFCREY